MSHGPDCFCAECRGEPSTEPQSFDSGPRIEHGADRIWYLCPQCGMEIDLTKLPAATGSAPAKAITKLPGAQGGSGGSYNDFLKPSHIAKRGNSLILTGNIREGGSKFGPSFNVEVKHGKKLYDFSVKISSGNYRRLLGSFGDNPAKWKGKKIDVIVAENMGNEYIQIQD